MNNSIKPIGGEFWFQTEIFNNKNQNFKDKKATFLSGGQSAIRFILDDLSINEKEIILMPNHLCPTIINTLNIKNINYDFYKINKDLSIDLNSIEEKIVKQTIKSVYIINYFGFYYDEETRAFLKKLKDNYNIKIIEDAVQMFWFNENNNFVGDYVFNSYRKIVPIDGSIVLSQNNKEYRQIKDEYYQLMNKGRSQKSLYINYKIGSEEEYLNTFKKAEKAYYERKEIYGMNEISKKLLNNIDIQYIKMKRQENYKYLYKKIEKIKFIDIIFNLTKIKGIIPLGFPVYIKNNNRDKVRKILMNNKIYSPIHWNINNEIGKNILTIPIDQRYDFEDMDRICDYLYEIERILYD